MKRLASIALFALAAYGCSDDGIYYYDDGYYYDPPPLECSADYLEATIDTGAYIDIDPGEGVGATIEYLGDGAWRVAVACDTYFDPYERPCTWDLVLTSIDGIIEDFAPERLERDDALGWYPTARDDSVRLLSTTAYDLDAITLFTTPGAALSIDALLDDQCGAPYLIWVEAGDYATSDAIETDLYPSEP
jgi:hypothetical protein